MSYVERLRAIRSVLSAATRQKCCITAEGFNVRNAICTGFQSPQNASRSVYTDLPKPLNSTRNLAIV